MIIPQNIVYLVKPSSFKGWVISLVTKTPYSHAVIEIGGICYDASESRGNFDVSDIDLSKRKYTAFVVEGDLSEWLSHNYGRGYDWRGVLGWIFDRKGDPDKFYCFEAVRDALMFLGISKAKLKRTTGIDILVDIALAKRRGVR